MITWIIGGAVIFGVYAWWVFSNYLFSSDFPGSSIFNPLLSLLDFLGQSQSAAILKIVIIGGSLGALAFFILKGKR